ncbi:alkaline phosphatase family protein [Halorussus salinus]|uniref:hypothetical protein n=1 Tax=Halorussus salinus TaxID=1364935 RepID=UPI0010928EC5|nr:hypothetical protein [Halorussus salinus]
MLAQWASRSVKRVREDGLHGAKQSLRYPYIYALQSLGAIHKSGDNIYSREWDLLIILDACRADLLQSVSDQYDFLGSGETMWSKGAVTKEWMQETFVGSYASEMNKTAYICGNPHSDSELDSSNFELLDETWREAWESTIPPRAVTDRAVEIARTSRPEKMIVHYMQPHCPFISWGDKAQVKSADNFGEQDTKDVWQRLRDGEVNKAEVWQGYRENLQIALDEVETLLASIDADTAVITSDHGNALGEWGVYGHKPRLPLACLREVPWEVTSAVDTGAYEPTYVFEDSDVSKQEQLEALGYL